MDICIVCGARPNFIKVAPLIRAIRAAQNEDGYRLVYTGSAADPDVEPGIFADLQIPPPDECLGVTSLNLNELTGAVMQRFDAYLQRHAAGTVVVVDDLASTMAVAIVAKKRGLRLAHMAAGTRSFDINMPKEVNRLVIDGLSDILFTAGASNNSIANREGAELSKVYMVGNILIDNLRFVHPLLQPPPLAAALGLVPGGYLVFTLNRKVLMADRQNMRRMVAAIVGSSGGVPVVAPLRAAAAGVVADVLPPEAKGRFHIVDPQPYLRFSWLAAHAKGVVTDSGNVAEEATFNHVPCITLNSYTEHMETVRLGTNVLVGEDAARLGAAVAGIVAGRWTTGQLPDRWDGRTAERMLSILGLP